MITQKIRKGEINSLKGTMQGAQALKIWSVALTIVISATSIEHVLYDEVKAPKGSKIFIPT